MNHEELVLELMNQETYKPMNIKELSAILNVSKNELDDFKKILNSFEEKGKIIKTEKEKYMVITETDMLSGVFQAHKNGYGFINTGVEGEADLFVTADNTLNAFNGDTVLYKIINKNSTENMRMEAKILKVVGRQNKEVVGLFVKSKNFGFIVPDEKRLVKDVFIPKNKIKNAKNFDKVVINITKWPENNRKAEGEVVEILGNISEKGVDILSIIKLHGLPIDFPAKVLNEVVNIPSEVEYDNKKYDRRDLRKEKIVTIDGEDAKDLDDAVIVKRLDNGNYFLGVHIADVSNYVKDGSALDKEAIDRGTSVYFPDRVIPMLPKELSNGICSLNAGVDRFALSIEMEINNEGNVIKHDVFKSVINVKERMTYTNVYKILEQNDELLLKRYKNFINDFKLMKELALILRKKRVERGSIDFDIPEAKIILDDKGVATEVKEYEITIANKIIEEFMLISNETIAEKMFWLEAPFIYRVHEEPTEGKIDTLNQFITELGYKIKGTNNLHPKAMQEVLDKIKGMPEERIISTLILRSLKLAKYKEVCEGHFGLGAKYYCHFTSPIRRYPDLFIHRVISNYIDNGWVIPEIRMQQLKAQAISYSKQSSERERIAELAERDCDDMKKAEYMAKHVGEEFEGIISSVTNFGFFVELPNTIEGLVRFDNINDNDYYAYDEEKHRLIGERTKRIFKIGDIIKVFVEKADPNLREIDFKLI